MKLAIAIPTFNRAAAVAALLAELARQVSTLHVGDSVEVFIQDNATPDRVEIGDAITCARDCGLVISVERNPCNIGPDANFVYLLGRARGDYVWFLGDDDILRPSALRDILAELRAVEGAHYVAFSFGMDGLARPGKYTMRRQFDSLPAYIEDTMWHSSFISISVFRGDVLAEALARSQCSYYVGGCVIQLHIVSEVLRAAGEPRIVLSPLVILDQTRAVYTDWGKVSDMFLFGIGRFAYQLADSGEEGKRASRALLGLAASRMPVGLLAAKAKGDFSYRGLALLLYTYGRFPLVWFSVFLACVIPGFILMGFRRLYLKQSGLARRTKLWLKQV